MTQDLFDVYLTGRVLEGHHRREVIVNLAQITGTSLPEATRLLEAAQRMKTAVAKPEADLYQEILEETGAEALVRACLQFSDTRVAPVPTSAPLSPPVLETPSAPPVQPGVSPAPLPTGTDIDIEATEPPDLPARRVAWRLLALLLMGVLVVGGSVAAVWRWQQAHRPGAQLSRVGETLNRVQPFQQQVEAFWQQQGRFPAIPIDLQWVTPPFLGEDAHLNLGGNGRLIITFTRAAGDLAGATLELIPAPGDSGIQWQCGGGTLDGSERPPECR